MATRTYCDSCKREINAASKNHRQIIIRVDNEDKEAWDLCEDCFVEAKLAMIKSFIVYQNDEYLGRDDAFSQKGE